MFHTLSVKVNLGILIYITWVLKILSFMSFLSCAFVENFTMKPEKPFIHKECCIRGHTVSE